MPKTAAGEFVLEIVRKFPDAPTLTLAKKCYRQHPELFTSVENARGRVREYRGNSGSAQRIKTGDKDCFRPNGKAGELLFPAIPEPLQQITDRDPFLIETPGRWLIMSDVHLPYHDATAIRAVWSYALGLGVRGVLLNGDTQDFYAISRWETDPRKRNFAGEIKSGVEFRTALRQAVGKKTRIVEKLGNHDERLELYLMRKAPELLDIEAMDYKNLLGLEPNGIECVGEKRPIRLGKLYVLHGHEYRGGFIPPVGAARWLFLRTQESAICGHFHSSSSYSKNTIGDHTVTCWATGCLCDRKPLYARLNDWNSGAAMVEVGKDGSYSVSNFRVVDGKVWS